MIVNAVARQWVGSRIYAQNRWMRLLAIAVAAGTIVAALVAIARFLHSSLFFTSWASSAALLLTTPGSPACRPGRICASHLSAAIVGIACQSAMPGAAWAIGVAVGISVAIVLSADLLHPPAMANAAFAFSRSGTTMEFIFTAAIGACVLALVPLAIDVIRRRAPWQMSDMQPIKEG